MNNKPHGICACGEHAWTMLTRGYVAFADPEDLPVIQERSWSVAIRPGSETRRSYPTAVGHARKKHIRLANRIAASETMLDHADRDSMNCRRRNLRPADAAQNARNRRPKLGRIYKGVMKNGKRWRAGVWFDGANRYSGPFDTPEEAAMAYNRMALALQGEFAVLNDLSKLSGYPLVEGKQGVTASSSTVCGEGTLPSPSVPPRSAGKCSTCRHFIPEASGFGFCARWRTGYHVSPAEMASDEALVENDEGWGMLVGPDFGCVLHNPPAEGEKP